jgi:hypothetical protein
VISRTLAAVALAQALAASGCDPPSPADPAPSASERPADATAPRPRAQPARRGRLIAGERVARVPQWPAQVDQPTRDRLPAATRAAVDRSSVPVLAPTRAGWLSSARVYVHDHGYALSARDGEVQLALQASRTATLLPHVGRSAPSVALRGAGGFTVANDGIRSASWIEHSVAYSLDLECFRPRDPACDEAALRAAVEALVYVGGAGGAR